MFWNDYFLINMKKAPTKRKLARMENNIVFVNVFMQLFEIALNRYKVDGLPETISKRLLLQSMIAYGNVVVFEKDGGLLALPGVPNGAYNVEGDFVKAWVFSKNGIVNEEVDLFVKGASDMPLLYANTFGVTQKTSTRRGVMVWENQRRYPFIHYIYQYADSIADTMRTLDVARKWIKVPFIPVCKEELVESTKLLINDILNNMDVLEPISTGIFQTDSFNILPIQQSTDSIKTACELIDWYEQKFRGLCGLRTNTNIDKKGENLISDEIHANDSYTDTVTESLAEYLQSQFDFVNECFGTHITVKENETLQSENEYQGGVTDENIE